MAFYESCRQGSHVGNVVKFSPEGEGSILLAAGIWNKWTDHHTGEIISSFCIITDEPVPFIREVGHDRQPVFLSKDNAEQWLETNKLLSVEAYKFLKSNQMPINYIVEKDRALKGYSSNTTI